MRRPTEILAILLTLLLAVGCSAPDPDRSTATAMAASTAKAAQATITAADATTTAVLEAQRAAVNVRYVQPRPSAADVTATIVAATAIAPHNAAARATAVAARISALIAAPSLRPAPRPTPTPRRISPQPTEDADSRAERTIGQALVRLGRSGHSGTERWDAHTCALLRSADSRGLKEVWNTPSGTVRFGTLDQYLQAPVREGPRDWENESTFALILDHC